MKHKKDDFDKQLSKLDDAEAKIKHMNKDMTHLVEDYGKSSRDKQRSKNSRATVNKKLNSDMELLL